MSERSAVMAQECVLLIPPPPPYPPPPTAPAEASLLWELALNALRKGGVLEPIPLAASLLIEPKPLGDCGQRL